MMPDGVNENRKFDTVFLKRGYTYLVKSPDCDLRRHAVLFDYDDSKATFIYRDHGEICECYIYLNRLLTGEQTIELSDAVVGINA